MIAPILGMSALSRARAEHDHPTRDWTRDCQLFVRSRFGVGGMYGSAIQAWYNTNRRHTSWPPPPAVPAFYAGGSYGHVVMSIGDGTCWSNDYYRRGRIDRVGILTIAHGWNYRYLGWAEDINEAQVYDQRKVVDISQAVWATKNRRAINHGIALKRALGAEVGKGQMRYDNHILGTGFRRQYAVLQRRWYGRGDGIPGATSLTRLCARHDLLALP